MITTSNVVQLKPAIPASWLVLDIETGDASADAVQEAVNRWKAPSNWKPETAEAKREEATAKIREKAALLDASPILCVAAQTDRESLIFSGMGTSAVEIPGWSVAVCDGERAMLYALREWLDSTATPETVLAGHNLIGFDLPKLRQAYIRHRLRLPSVLLECPNTVDTMRLASRFTMEHRDSPFLSLDTLAGILGLERPKAVVSGADVPRLHREGRTAEILTYCALDTSVTTRAFLLMSGRAGDLS